MIQGTPGTVVRLARDVQTPAREADGRPDWMDVAQRALEAGQWSTARSAFEAALEREETAEALHGLGTALCWLEEAEASLRIRERAYAAFRRRPDPFHAAQVAFQLCPDYGASLGNLAAARGWLGRLARLVEEFELASLEGWVLLGRAVLASAGDDHQAAEAFAREAHEAARRFADADLELRALSEIGGALVQMGRVLEGTALLDEAMAGALSGEGSRDTVLHTRCRTIVACGRTSDVKRAAQWIRAAEEFNRRYGSGRLCAVCRTQFGTVLLGMGRWAEAEIELRAALDVSMGAECSIHAKALAKLSELRLAQGRIEEAARLLDGFEDHAATTYALACIRFARGELAASASLLRRRLCEIGQERIECAELLELLTEVEIARGAMEAATASARRLAAVGASTGSDLVVARAHRALGRALAATGADQVTRDLERALEAFARLELPLETGRTRLLLARAIAESEPESAIVEARSALASFSALGAACDADAAAALLRTLGVTASRPSPRGIGVLTRRELEVLRLLGEGLSNREMAERLFLTRKTVENHVAGTLSKL